MLLGLATWSYHKSFGSGEITIDTFIKNAFELGVDGVEFNDRFLATDKLMLDHVKRMLATYGLGLSQITVDNNFCSANSERRNQERYVKKWVDAAYHLGSFIVRINAGWPPKHMEKKPSF
jgi:sugar phosphate isomerase/epimerase